jgi:hypothetical protein
MGAIASPIKANIIRFTTGSFQLVDRPQFLGLRLQPFRNLSPIKSLVAVHVFFKTDFNVLISSADCSGDNSGLFLFLLFIIFPMDN